MKPFNTLTSAVPPSGIRKIYEMSLGIEGCLHLETGQPDFRTPEHILEAVAQAARDGFTQYTSSAGIPELVEAIARKVVDKNGFQCEPKNIVVSAGAICSLLTTLFAVVEHGDEVLIPDPAWPNYMSQMAVIGSVGVQYPLIPSEGFTIDFDALEKRVTPKTKAMIINTPGNPTGAVFKPETVEKIVEFANRHDLYLISDEVYEDIIFEGAHTSAGLFDHDGRVITIFGFSKTYAATGLRMGYSVCEEKLAALITKLQQPVVICPPSISQKGCVAALNGPQDSIGEMVSVYRSRRDIVVEILKENGLYTYTPEGAFYIMVDISKTGMNSEEFCLDLLKQKKVAVAPGDTFGEVSSKFVRIAFCTDTEKLITGTNLLCDYINGTAPPGWQRH
ncbi:pyridoxal phosphate-dependent aminotransferase [Candidatus Latescibacterota bacterium]